MTVRPRFENLGDWLAAKPGGHFVVERWGNGWAINVRRVGCFPETILCKTRAEAYRHRLQLSDEGLTGYVMEGA